MNTILLLLKTRINLNILPFDNLPIIIWSYKCILYLLIKSNENYFIIL